MAPNLIPIKNSGDGCLSAGTAHADTMPAWKPDGPNLRFKEMLKVTRVSKSKAYELIKKDPAFPKGIPLYDSERSPKIYRVSDALAWIEMRSKQSLTKQEKKHE
jgi:predicted DNA-binding transcriptional regulator AlpA